MTFFLLNKSAADIVTVFKGAFKDNAMSKSQAYKYSQALIVSKWGKMIVED